MSKSLKIILVIVIPLVFAGAVFAGTYFSMKHKTDQEKSDLNKQITALRDERKKLEDTLKDPTLSWKTYHNLGNRFEFKYPISWYPHGGSKDGVFLLKSEQLPDIGATETWAYGDQIEVGGGKMVDGESKPITRSQWMNLYIDSYVSKLLTLKREWKTVHNQKMLRIESLAGEASGKVLTYYLFSGDEIYHLMLYPYELKTAIGKSNFKTFQQILNTFHLIKK